MMKNQILMDGEIRQVAGSNLTGYNSRFAKAGFMCFYVSEVLNSSFEHLMKFSAENPRLRKAANRCASL